MNKVIVFVVGGILALVLYIAILGISGIITIRPSPSTPDNPPPSAQLKALDAILSQCVGTVGVSINLALTTFGSPELSVTCSEVSPTFINTIKDNL